MLYPTTSTGLPTSLLGRPIILIAISYHGREGKKGQVGSPRKIFTITPFPTYGSALFDIEMALQRRHFCLFAENGRDLDS